MSLSTISNLEEFQIPLDEILLATDNFNKELVIGDGGYGVVYRGQLSERRQYKTAAIKRVSENSYQSRDDFYTQLEMVILFQHENVNAFIGYCDENSEMIIVHQYAANRSLDLYLLDPNKICRITWEQRLKICIGIAKGIKYLYSGLGENRIVIHRNVKSANIVFDDNMTAQICGFDVSIQCTRYQPRVYTSGAVGSKFYADPVYIESGVVRTEIDVYSFGVVMFELLSGMTVFHERSVEGDNPGPLMHLVRRYQDDVPDKLVDPHIKDQINSLSLNLFIELARNCISFNYKERPTMSVIIKTIEEALEIHVRNSHLLPNLEDFLIPLNEIKRATKNFYPKDMIGSGGYGSVYKGQLSERWENRKAAIKRLTPDSHQGEEEFLNEVRMISGFSHANIIPFIGYCNEDNERIIVSEYAMNGSLDRHIGDPKKRSCLTWVQRLKISLGVARGLHYLHSGLGGNKRVIHRDIKSANVLLDKNMEAQICDFGLSRSGLSNQPHSLIYTKVAGTRCYVDPTCIESGILHKETDVYSYGVVLFELFSGMLAYHRKHIGEHQPLLLMHLVRRYSDNQTIQLIDPLIRNQIDDHSLQMFQEIAYKCVTLNPKERPTMRIIIKKIEELLQYASKVISSSSLTIVRKNEDMFCECGNKMYVQTSWTNSNPGRRFVSCSNYESGKCKYHVFLDPELPNERYKEMMYQMKVQIDNMRLMMGNPPNVLDGDNEPKNCTIEL